MKKWFSILGVLLLFLFIAALGALAVVSNHQATLLIHNPLAQRPALIETPANYGLKFETVSLTTADGLRLAGWYIPSQNGAAVIAQHGYKATRQDMLNDAAMLARHGYGVILIDLRAHGQSQGNLITFGRLEPLDLDAAYHYLLSRPGVDPERIGVLGDSMGAVTVILYAAQNSHIKAVVAQSPYASLQEEVATGVEYFTDLPTFPFAPMIQYFAEQQAGFSARQVAPIEHIAEISPRPVFLMQGGQDNVIPPNSGQRLYQAAGEPRQLWFEPQLGHVEFDTKMPAEYEQRVTAFFDRYLLGKK